MADFNNIARKAPKAFSIPDDMVLKYSSDIPTGNILDIGCNQGANIIPFLYDEYNYVEGIDPAGEPLKNLLDNLGKLFPPEELKDIMQNRLKLYNTNISGFKFKINYNLIMAIKVLHYLDDKEIDKLIDNMKKHTNPHGYNIILAWNRNLETKITLLSQEYLIRKYQEKNWEIKESIISEEGERDESVYLIAKKLK